MGCCCSAGTGTGCCCEETAFNYVATFSGVYEAGAGTGTGTGTGDDLTGCFLANRSFCLCYGSCGRYETDFYQFFEGSLYTPCVRTFNNIRLVLDFDCSGTPGTGSGTGTVSEPGVVTLKVYGVCSYTDGVAGFGGVLLATYQLGRRSWHCSDPSYTFYLSSYDSSYCLGWPSTVTIVKDQSTLLCRCTCRPADTSEIGDVVTYEVRFGATAGTGCSVGECGCESPALHICMRDMGGCYWMGEWNPPTGVPPFPVIETSPSGTGYLPQMCLIAYPLPQIGLQHLHFVHMYYYPPTNKILFGWKAIGNLNTSDGINLTTNDDNWAVKYSIDAASFQVFGNNTFTYEGGSYTACTFPSTIQVNYYHTANYYCDFNRFDCDICDPGKSLPGGWAITMSGVTGAQDIVTPAVAQTLGLPYLNIDGCFGECNCAATPCDTVNGDYCLGNFQQNGSLCTWSSSGVLPGTSDGMSYGPYAHFYNLASGNLDWFVHMGDPCRWYTNVLGNTDSVLLTYTTAHMGINGGVVWVAFVVSKQARWNDIVRPPPPIPTINAFYGLNYPDATEWCHNVWYYVIGLDDFDCEGANTLTLFCSQAISPEGYSPDDSCDCSMPSTISITPTDECGITVEPPPECPCLTPTVLNPIVRISGIGMGDGSCLDCKCQADLTICFTGGSDCVWSATGLSLDDTVDSCNTDVASATLQFDSSYPGMLLTIKNSLNATLIQYYVSTEAGTGTGPGFSCPGGPYTMQQIGVTPDPTCGWPLDAHLTMDETCPTCEPCVPTTIAASYPYGMNFTFQFDSTTYSLCCYQQTSCTFASATKSTGLVGSSAGVIRAVVDFGANPKNYARVYIYFDPTGAGTGDTLIGVYGYLLDIDTFACDGSNSMSLTAGNFSECGWQISAPPYTNWLSSTGTLRGDTCYLCDNTAFANTFTGTLKSLASPTCVDDGATDTLTFNSGTQEWSGTIDCPGVSETLQISIRQTGPTCLDLECDVTYVNSCDIGVLSAVPYDCSCSGKYAKFKITGTILLGSDELWITWV